MKWVIVFAAIFILALAGGVMAAATDTNSNQDKSTKSVSKSIKKATGVVVKTVKSSTRVNARSTDTATNSGMKVAARSKSVTARVIGYPTDAATRERAVRARAARIAKFKSLFAKPVSR